MIFSLTSFLRVLIAAGFMAVATCRCGVPQGTEVGNGVKPTDKDQNEGDKDNPESPTNGTSYDSGTPASTTDGRDQTLRDVLTIPCGSPFADNLRIGLTYGFATADAAHKLSFTKRSSALGMLRLETSELTIRPVAATENPFDVEIFDAANVPVKSTFRCLGEVRSAIAPEGSRQSYPERIVRRLIVENAKGERGEVVWQLRRLAGDDLALDLVSITIDFGDGKAIIFK